MEETLVPKGEQRIEGGEEARVMMRVHEQGRNCWRNTLLCLVMVGRLVEMLRVKFLNFQKTLRE
jgi:hypothetical protein